MSLRRLRDVDLDRRRPDFPGPKRSIALPPIPKVPRKFRGEIVIYLKLDEHPLAQEVSKRTRSSGIIHLNFCGLLKGQKRDGFAGENDRKD